MTFVNPTPDSELDDEKAARAKQTSFRALRETGTTEDASKGDVPGNRTESRPLLTSNQCSCPRGSYHIKHTPECYESQVERLRTALRELAFHAQSPRASDVTELQHELLQMSVARANKLLSDDVSAPETSALVGMKSISLEPRGSQVALIVCFDSLEHAQGGRDRIRGALGFAQEPETKP